MPMVEATFETADGEADFDTTFDIPQSLADLIQEFTDSLGTSCKGNKQVNALAEFQDPAWDRIEAELIRLASEQFLEMRICQKDLELAHCGLITS